jgi:hypothetical protein
MYAVISQFYQSIDTCIVTFDVHYSIDNGTTFQPLLASLTGSSAQINTLELGGSNQAILRVTAFDGSHTATAATAPFAVANKPPVVQILNPGNNAQVHYGQLINFIGEAFDPQWGAFEEANLKWSSEQGPLGSGAMLAVTTLPVGQHTITFSAKNSAGLESSKSITLYVDDNLDATGPTLKVAPIQLGWNFQEGATTVQTATLSVANVGSGIMNWSASTSAPWLSLSAASGTAPQEITVTADPSKIPDGANISSSIVVTGATGPQVIAVPVHAAFGNGYVLPASGPEEIPNEAANPIFLPWVSSSEP